MRGILVFLAISTISAANAAVTTEDRIRKHGYPVERHTVQTSDAYILTIYRIPHPPNVKNDKARPIAFLQHGLLSSSDCWILNGPGIALAYMLVDAGYDVWLGNNRGNTYSRKHVKYSTSFPSFWNFEWHQIALYDMPAMIDYALFQTNQKSLHYVGHSQGTTVLFVLTSILPKYNEKIKSAQLLAPVAFMNNIKGPLVTIATPLLGQPNALVELFGSMEFLPNNKLMRALKAQACKDNLGREEFCSNFMFTVCGWDRKSLNMTLFEDIIRTHPAGSSVNQLIHFLQEHKSGEFRQFDYGFVRNKVAYGHFSPPNYNLKQVTAPIFLYYADNDFLSHPLDVYRLIKKLPNVHYSFRVPDPKWNHLDHLWANNVKEMIFDRVLENVNKMESLDYLQSFFLELELKTVLSSYSEYLLGKIGIFMTEEILTMC